MGACPKIRVNTEKNIKYTLQNVQFYEDRLIKFNLTTLERKCEREDIIQTYKILHGLSDV